MQPETDNDQQDGSYQATSVVEEQAELSPKKVNRPLVFMFAGIVVIATGFLIVLTVLLIRGPYPSYDNPQNRQVFGYNARVFTGWIETENVVESSKSMVFTDYVDDEARSENDKLAQQVITVIDALVPAKDLVDAYKKELTTSIVNDGALFKNTSSVALCTSMSESRAAQADSLQVPQAFAVYDFSFACPSEGRQPPIQAVGRLVVSNDGSAVIHVIAATEAVFNKNATQFKDAVTNLYKEG